MATENSDWKYNLLRDFSRSTEDLRGDGPEASFLPRPKPRPTSWVGAMLKAGRVLLVISNTILLVTIAAGVFSRSSPSPACTDQDAAVQTSFYSPILQAGIIEYETRTFQGGFAAENIYKGKPHKALDHAWHKACHADNMSAVDGDVLDRMGVPRTAAQYADEDGGKYMILVEVFHQLHCLNLVRMYTYRDYYDLPENRPLEFTDRESTLRLHIDHCIDILRQVLTCQADVGLVPFYFVDGMGPNEDFSTPHKCRKMDHIVEWADRNVAPASEPVRRPDSLWLSELPG